MPFGYRSIWVRVAVPLLAACFQTRAIAADVCPTGPAVTFGTPQCSSNKTGTDGAFGWSIWSSGSGGCITPSTNSSAYKATWSNSGDFLARMGFQWNETKTFDQYGTVSADYAYTKTGTAGGYSFIGIYGWSNNPLVEYYIVDDWFGSGSGSAPTAGGSLQGTFSVDGGTYKIYTHQQVNQPSIHGNTTFNQIFSIRQSPRQCGHISISEHYQKWKGLGLELGKMFEAKLLIEAGGGTGSIEYSVGTMSSGPAISISRPPGIVPEWTRDRDFPSGNGNGGVISLISLNGTVIKSTFPINPPWPSAHWRRTVSSYSHWVGVYR